MGTATVLALVLAWPAPVPADTVPPAPIRAPALPLLGPRPAEIVAAQVRSVLGDHRNARAWKELAGVLPEMALVGGADLEGTFEAARLADSISSARDEAAVDVPSGAALKGASSRSRGAIPSDGTAWSALRPEVPVLAAGVIAFTLLLLGVRAVGRRRSRGRPSPGREAQGRIWAARSLASSGMPVREIARRTGMAQDAVHVLLGMGERNPPRRAPAAGRRPQESPGRPANSARRLDAERDRLKAEITVGARRLRDGRLTYGGGR